MSAENIWKAGNCLPVTGAFTAGKRQIDQRFGCLTWALA